MEDKSKTEPEREKTGFEIYGHFETGNDVCQKVPSGLAGFGYVPRGFLGNLGKQMEPPEKGTNPDQ